MKKSKIISAAVKDGKVRQIAVNFEITVRGVGFRIVGMNDISIKTFLLMTFIALQNERFWIPRRKMCLVLEPEVTDYDGTYFEFPAAVGIIVADGQATLRELDRCILTGKLDLDGRLEDLPDPLALAEYARERNMLAVMPKMQALSLPKELIDHTLMIDSLHELVEVLEIKREYR